MLVSSLELQLVHIYRSVNFSNNRGKQQATLTDKDGKSHSVFWTKFLKIMKDRKNENEDEKLE